jgi:hypothetical protein
MFQEAKVFNQSLDHWDVRHVQHMVAMFQGAVAMQRFPAWKQIHYYVNTTNIAHDAPLARPWWVTSGLVATERAAYRAERMRPRLVFRLSEARCGWFDVDSPTPERLWVSVGSPRSFLCLPVELWRLIDAWMAYEVDTPQSYSFYMNRVCLMFKY